MADDFEKAILFSFDQTGSVDAALRAQALALLQSVKQSPGCWELCLERFASSSYVEVKFWCLQSLEELIRTSYAQLHVQASAACGCTATCASTTPDTSRVCPVSAALTPCTACVHAKKMGALPCCRFCLLCSTNPCPFPYTHTHTDSHASKHALPMHPRTHTPTHPHTHTPTHPHTHTPTYPHTPPCPTPNHPPSGPCTASQQTDLPGLLTAPGSGGRRAPGPPTLPSQQAGADAGGSGRSGVPRHLALLLPRYYGPAGPGRSRGGPILQAGRGKGGGGGVCGSGSGR
jgi:hypothetical protein